MNNIGPVTLRAYTDDNAQAIQQLAQAIKWGQVLLTSELADSIAELNGECAALLRRRRENELPPVPPNDPRYA
jgi:hypothetical protein